MQAYPQLQASQPYFFDVAFSQLQQISHNSRNNLT
jgi:hypothetical protein